MESKNPNRVTRQVWCENCKNFTTQDVSKIVTLPETLNVKIWAKCTKCQNYWVKDINRNEWWNLHSGIRTHYRLD